MEGLFTTIFNGLIDSLSFDLFVPIVFIFIFIFFTLRFAPGFVSLFSIFFTSLFFFSSYLVYDLIPVIDQTFILLFVILFGFVLSLLFMIFFRSD